MLQCRPCATADPASNTVRVDFAKLTAMRQAESLAETDGNGRKQQEPATGCGASEASCEEGRVSVVERLRRERGASEDAQELRQQELRARADGAEEEHRQMEREAVEAVVELQRRREEQKRQLEQEEERRRRELQARAEAAEREHRLMEEDALRVAREAERREAEEQSARARLDVWLREHGFSGVNARRKSMVKSKFPLHSAVKRRDEATIVLLLRFGAEPNLSDSKGLTALQLARRCNQDGSCSSIIELLEQAEDAGAAEVSRAHPRGGG